MKVALITTPPSIRSGIGDYTRHLLPYLREHCEVRVFVEHGHDDPGWRGEEARSIDALEPREFDQILYQLGNERAHAFMPRLLRAIGGTVVQHDWVLFDMALAAWQALSRGGAKGHALALREGGLRQARLYSANWRDRRRQRMQPAPEVDVSTLEGTLLSGWHAPEPHGRWTADHAWLRIPADGVEAIELDLHIDAGRSVSILEDRRVLAQGVDPGSFEVRPGRGDRPLLCIATAGIQVTKQQRKNGDVRRMGCFVRKVTWRDARGVHELDLNESTAIPCIPISISRDRFRLALNRSVVRFADAFIVHSRYVAERILGERNSPTPIGLVHHGAERRWREGERHAARAELGLPADWLGSFLVVSFGGVQPHKRVDQMLHALARARREREDLRLVLAGSLHSGEFDPVALAKRLGLADAVRFTGFLPEERAWDWLFAADLALNLRGPTTGGTSGGIFQAFSMGRAVIATDAAEQRELPDACVIKVPLEGDEVPALARELVRLRDDPGRRERLESAVRRFVQDECHWTVVARRYAEHLRAFPRARVSRKKLVALKLARRT